MDFDKGNTGAPKRPAVKSAGRANHANAKPIAQASTPKPEAKKVAPTPKPKQNHLKLKLKKPSPKTLLISAMVAAVLIITLIVIAAYNRPSANQPHYKTVLPSGKSIDSLGGWRRVSPMNGDPVYAYIDKINGVTVNVSQQPLPTNLEGDKSDKLEEIAKQFNSTKRIKETNAFIGTSSKGPQSVLFLKGNTLVLIKSQQEIPEKNWSEYIRSLR